jgi:hypothetical protein
MTILTSTIEPQYTPYGHLIAFRITLTNKVNESRKVDVAIDITYKDAASDSKAGSISKAQEKGVELRGLEVKILDIVIDPPLLIKDGGHNAWKIEVAEKK